MCTLKVFKICTCFNFMWESSESSHITLLSYNFRGIMRLLTKLNMVRSWSSAGIRLEFVVRLRNGVAK